jgi:hypothetical protein
MKLFHHERARLVLLAACMAGTSGNGCSGNTPVRGGMGGDSGGSGEDGGSGGGATGGAGASAGHGGASGGAGDAGATGGASGEGGGGGSASDAAAPDDAGEATGGAGGAAPGGPVLLVIANDPDPSPNNGMMMELTAKGLKFEVQNSSTMPLTPASANGKSLVIINPNTPRGNVPASFKDVAVPVIVSKDGPATQMMMATAVGSTDPAQTTIDITMPSDALAAGFPAGKLTIYPKGNRVIFGTPTADGKTVATTNGGAAIFYYPAGAAMVGGFKAPAKRVGFFWHRTSDVTANGRKLFSAAIDWALKP